jgi:hypothetical protein
MASKASHHHHHHHYDRISPLILPYKMRSQSSDTISNRDFKLDSSSTSNKKKLSSLLTDFDIKTTTNVSPLSSSATATAALRRRFSLFRLKRSQTTHDFNHIQTLEQIIVQLRRDLHMKTVELDTTRERIKRKRHHHIVLPTNESIEHAMQLQTVLNDKLDDMLLENESLKKSIYDLEAFVQRDIRKCHAILVHMSNE